MRGFHNFLTRAHLCRDAGTQVAARRDIPDAEPHGDARRRGNVFAIIVRKV
jgi:hypothetical protein